jgi:superfamily II DNA or RNA helicase
MELQIQRIDGALRVNPAPPYITTYLQYNHRSFEREKYQMVNKWHKRLLYSNHPDGGVITFQGFYHKLADLIHKNGDVLRVEDMRTQIGEPDLQAVKDINWEAIGSTGPRDYQIDPIVEFLYKAKDGSGIVNATGGWGKTVMQAVTYAAYNHLKHAILAIPLKEVFTQTYEKFCQMFPDKHIGRVGGGYHDISEDITITTFKSLPKCAIEKCQLLLVDEIQGTTGDKILETLMQVQPIRMFGYTATDQNLFNGADKLVKGLFGERLIFVPYEDAQEDGAVVPCVVYFVKMPETAFIDASTIEAKLSRGIKKNDIRNKLIADVCKEVPNGWQTLVFVDHIEDHLVQLYKHMPNGTKYLHRGTSKKELGAFALSNKEQELIIEEFKSNQFQYLIATDAFRAGVDIPNLRVVVQGAGGSSEVEILQEAYRGSRTLPDALREELGSDEKTHFVLVDFLDSHDGTLENMSYKRMDIYKKQGWVIKEVDSPADIDWYDFAKKPKLARSL